MDIAVQKCSGEVKQTHPLRSHCFALASFYVRVTSHLKNSAEAEFFCVVWCASAHGVTCPALSDRPCRAVPCVRMRAV